MAAYKQAFEFKVRLGEKRASHANWVHFTLNAAVICHL